MKGYLKYIIGAIIILILVYFILLSPLPILIYPGLPHISLLRRAIGIFIMAGLFCLIRISRGPTASDRIVAVDMLGILIVGLCAVLTIVTGRNWYLDIGIAWALQSFISTLALSKFLEGKHFDD
ncbi:MAG: multiple resistance and pH regulation protein F [Candidatus Omnitrophota bacterium]|nr:MAG: multiple resistance and pH regulation protein F [Candidatus Omnitrophota bacterium]HDI45746.1 multiple resistance and pH regulation protein F [Candidatus Omnitrophota bacterium]